MKECMTCQVILTITDKCNLRCKYCYEHNRQNQTMDIEVARNIVSRYLMSDRYEMVDIVIFGGEPFIEFEVLHDLCEWTWEKKWKNNYIFDFSTNGTVLDEKIKMWLSANADKIKLTLSADGDEETQNINRDNSYRLIDYDFFVDTWEFPYVKMTIGKDTIHNLSNDIIFFHKKGFEFAECNLAEGVLWDKKDEEIFRIELEKLTQFYLSHPDVRVAPILDLELWKCESKEKAKRKCEIGRHIYAFDCAGNQYPCNYCMDMTFSDEEISEIRENLQKVDYSPDAYCYDECYLYPICKSCYAADYSLSKVFGKHNESRCKMVNAQAYYSALLNAEKIKNIDLRMTSEEDRYRLAKTIEAIRHIATIGEM